MMGGPNKKDRSMTEYEMISAAQGYVAHGSVTLMNFFTVLVAYLVAGYLMAGRVNFLMALFITTLFVAFSAIGIATMYNLGNILQALLIHMHDAALAGKDLKWAPVAQSTPNVWITGIVALTIMAFAVIGAVTFFFTSRAQQLKSAA